jgi:hypothetical protein
MAHTQLEPVVRHLRRLARTHCSHDLSDAPLLQRFAAHRDQTAFAALVERHGRLVLSVCRQVLHHEQDAEDAFQATFLVVAHQAAAVLLPGLPYLVTASKGEIGDGGSVVLSRGGLPALAAEAGKSKDLGDLKNEESPGK